MLDVGEVGAAAEHAPAGQGREGRGHGGAAAEDFGALAGDPLVEVAHAPERGVLAELAGADGDGVEELLDLGEAAAAATMAPMRWPVRRKALEKE